jgi:transcriptional regulator with XRE-family HTH domain
VTAEYARHLGERLRRIRLQKGLSLQDVQDSSRGQLKAQVVGAYERGDRNMTVLRLVELADFYGVSPPDILPEDDVGGAGGALRQRLVLDLERIGELPDRERAPLERFAKAVQRQRGDFNGRVLTIREDDLMALALLYETTSEEIAERLTAWGLLASDSG